MALIERKVVDQIVIEPETGTVLWREAIVIERDGVEIYRVHGRGSCPIDVDLPASAPSIVVPFRALADTTEARRKTKELRDKALRDFPAAPPNA